jgi:hypothetical protein
MKLRKGDELIAIEVARDESDLLVVTDNGYGKRTRVEELWTPLVEHTATIVEQMLERVATGEGHAKCPELGRGEIAVGAPRRLHVGDRRRILGDAVEFNPVAGAQNDQFVETRVCGERGVKRGGAFGAQSQSLAHGEGRAPMVGAEQKETGTVYERSRHGGEAAGNIARAR